MPVLPVAPNTIALVLKNRSFGPAGVKVMGTTSPSEGIWSSTEEASAGSIAACKLETNPLKTRSLLLKKPTLFWGNLARGTAFLLVLLAEAAALEQERLEALWAAFLTSTGELILRAAFTPPPVILLVRAAPAVFITKGHGHE